ncbi:MAG: hypothetical protein IIW88_10330, partial [Clostridia bacterium]|nr:hypothetical protein [Clostridia bacterium]
GMEAGVDVNYFDVPHEIWQNGIRNLVESGRMDRSVVEQAARRVLRAKMMLGLFENPYVDESLAEKVVQCQEHLQLANLAEAGIAIRPKMSVIERIIAINFFIVVSPLDYFIFIV